MKSLVIGGSGLVGNALINEGKERGHEVLGTYLNYALEDLIRLDYGNAEEVNKVLEFFNPDVIFCPAGTVNVDWIEENPDDSKTRNVEKLKVLFEIASKKGIPLAFFSTDYIFDGKGGPYDESAEPHPLNTYGKHKLEAEKMLQTMLPDNHYIFRTTWVYGQEKQEKNFLYSVIKKLSSGNVLEVPEDMVSTPSYVKDVANFAYSVVEKKAKGTFNLTGSETVSRYELAKKIASTFELNDSLIKPVKYDKSSRPANRPLSAGLKNHKVTSLNGAKWTDLDSGLKETRKKLEHIGQFPLVEDKITSKICIFIPCYNATSTLPKVFERIPKQIKNKVQEVFVVDNASEDYTYLMAVGLREKDKDIKNLKIFKNVRNFGYGGSQKLAYAYAIEQGYDLCVMLHGDAQYAPEKLPVMIEKMEKDKSIDLLFGSRMTGDPLAGGMPFHRYLGNIILTKFQNMLLGTKISEFHSGYRIFRTSSLKKVPFHLCDSYYHFDTEIIIQFINKKLNIDEVTINTFYGTEKCYVNIWKYAMHVAIVTSCFFLYKLGLRNLPKYELYNKEIDADINKIFEEFKTEIH